MTDLLQYIAVLSGLVLGTATMAILGANPIGLCAAVLVFILSACIANSILHNDYEEPTP